MYPSLLQQKFFGLRRVHSNKNWNRKKNFIPNFDPIYASRIKNKKEQRIKNILYYLGSVWFS